jgi:hypothetical protein
MLLCADIYIYQMGPHRIPVFDIRVKFSLVGYAIFGYLVLFTVLVVGSSFVSGSFRTGMVGLGLTLVATTVLIYTGSTKAMNETAVDTDFEP